MGFQVANRQAVEQKNAKTRRYFINLVFSAGFFCEKSFSTVMVFFSPDSGLSTI